MSLNKIGFIICVLILWVNLVAVCLYAQSPRLSEKDKFQLLRKGTDIYNFTGRLSWYTYYYVGLRSDELERYSETELQLVFRNINMLNSYIGLGYKITGHVFFGSGGLGGVGAGPLLRYYPLKSVRWQTYLQGGLAAGYNIALSSGPGISDVQGFRFRSSLKAGIGYRFSNAFGLFFEIGPSWEYTRDLRLDSHALLINIGIELFRF